MKINTKTVVPKEEAVDYDRKKTLEAFRLGYDAWILHIQRKLEGYYDGDPEQQDGGRGT